MSVPITYQIDHAQRLVNAYVHGVLTGADIERYQQEVWARPDVAGYNVIIDMSGATGVAEASAENMRYRAERSAQRDRQDVHNKFAVVAPEPLYYGLGRMYQAYRELQEKSTTHMRLFRTRQDALQWLVSPEEDTEVL